MALKGPGTHHDGVPVKYRQGPSGRFFDGEENVRSPGTRSEERFDTDEKKIVYFEKYGWIAEMFGKHPEVIAFSSAYYERTRRS